MRMDTPRVQWARFGAVALVVLCSLWQPPRATAVTLGTIGDSYTDDYAGQGYHHRNWVEQMAMHPTGVDFGGAGPGDLPFNFAIAGYWTGNALSQQSPRLLSNLDAVDYVVIDIGLNDFSTLTAQPGGYPYPERYVRIGRGEQSIKNSLNNIAFSNIRSIVERIRNQDPQQKIILATVPDWGATIAYRTPIIDQIFGIDYTTTGGPENEALRETFTAALTELNDQLVSYSLSENIAVVDKFKLLNKAKKSPKIQLTRQRRIGTSNDPGATGVEGGPYNFWADGLHPGTAWQGLYANVILDLLMNGYGEDVDLLTAQQIMSSYDGRVVLPKDDLHRAYVWSDYYLLPSIGGGAGAARMAALPEPASGALLMLAAAAISVRRRRLRPQS